MLTHHVQDFLGPQRSRLKKKVRLHLANNQASEARTLMEAHLSAHPDDADIRIRLAKVLTADGDLRAAVHHLSQAQVTTPSDVRIATLLAQIHKRLGDSEAEKRFKRERASLTEAQATTMEQHQAAARKHAGSIVKASLDRCFSSCWPSLVKTDSVENIADRVLASHSLDTIPLWSKHIPERYRLGDIAELEHIGRFLIGDVAQTLNKRLARGMPWELPTVALFMEIASRCSPEALIIDVGATSARTQCLSLEAFPEPSWRLNRCLCLTPFCWKIFS